MKWITVSVVFLLSTASYVYGCDPHGEDSTKGKKKRVSRFGDMGHKAKKPRRAVALKSDEPSFEDEGSVDIFLASSREEDDAPMEEEEEIEEEIEEDIDDQPARSPAVSTHVWAQAGTLTPEDITSHLITKKDLENYTQLTRYEFLTKYFPKHPHQSLNFDKKVSSAQQKDLNTHLKKLGFGNKDVRLFWILSCPSSQKERANLIQGAFNLKPYGSKTPKAFLEALLTINQGHAEKSLNASNPFEPLYHSHQEMLGKKNGWKKVEKALIEHANSLKISDPPPSENHNAFSKASETLPEKSKKEMVKVRENARALEKRQKRAYEKFAESAKNFLNRYQGQQNPRQALPKALQTETESQVSPDLKLTFSYPKAETINFADKIYVHIDKISEGNLHDPVAINQTVFPDSPYQLLASGVSNSVAKVLRRHNLGSREIRLLFSLQSIQVLTPGDGRIDEARKSALIDQEARNILKGAKTIIQSWSQNSERNVCPEYLQDVEFLYEAYGISIFSPLYEYVKDWKTATELANMRDFVYALCHYHKNNLSHEDKPSASVSADPFPASSSFSSSASTLTTPTSSYAEVAQRPPALSPSPPPPPVSPFLPPQGLSCGPRVLSSNHSFVLPPLKSVSPIGYPFRVPPPLAPFVAPKHPKEPEKIFHNSNSSMQEDSSFSLEISLSPLEKKESGKAPLSNILKTVPSASHSSSTAYDGWKHPPITEEEKLIERFFLATPYKILDKLFLDVVSKGNELAFDALTQFYVLNEWVNQPALGEKRIYNWTKIFSDWLKCQPAIQARGNLLLQIQHNLFQEFQNPQPKQKNFYEHQLTLIHGIAAAYREALVPSYLLGWIEGLSTNIELNLKNLELQHQLEAWERGE